MPTSLQPHILIAEAQYHPELGGVLHKGEETFLEMDEATFDCVQVPSASEPVIGIAKAANATKSGSTVFVGFAAQGVVILDRTKRSHDIANESPRAIIDVAVSESGAIGNGILAVGNDEQARLPAHRTEGDAGGFAARVALSMVGMKARLGG